MKRRFFLFAAPAIVAAPSLMRVSTAALTVPWNVDAEWIGGRLVSHLEMRQSLEANAVYQRLLARQVTGISDLMYGDGSDFTRRMGLGSLLSDEEYAQVTADPDEYA